MSDTPLHLEPGQWFVLNGARYGRCAHCVRPILPGQPSVLSHGADAGLAVRPPDKLAYHTECYGQPATVDPSEEALAIAIARFRAEMGEEVRAAVRPKHGPG